VRALLLERSIPRFAAARVASALGTGRGAGVGPLRLAELDPPTPLGADWHAVRPLLSGICGSDLSALDGRSSRYFEDLVSFPFVPGHEVVGTVEDVARDTHGEALAPGTRVVVEPALGCVARGIVPPCPGCAEGRTGNCELVAFGHLRPGLQTGYCADTGGGWSAAGLTAHSSQLYPVPDDLSDRDAVTVEPLACAVHAVLSAAPEAGDVVAVLGAGMVGLSVTAALVHLSRVGQLGPPAAVIVGARYDHQRRLAAELGADRALPSDRLARAVRRQSRTLAIGPSGTTSQLTGGADVVFDCVGSDDSIAQALALVRPRGRLVLVGMPGRLHLDLAPLWHREVRLVGAYAYGTEQLGGASEPGTAVRTFDVAMEIAAAAGTGRLVSATYPLERYEEAIAHAGAAGRRGATKVAFDPRAVAAPDRRQRKDRRR
jgi:threonine dehydrogenase-like Zn-dependent dehydrogenase